MIRLDVLLYERGLCSSRAHAQKAIKAGRVRVAGKVQTKPGLKLDADTDVLVEASEEDRYVSRGGLKLAGALEQSVINPEGLTCLDIGASTGGFTDCLIQAGAQAVVGIDVGRDQQAQKLQDDARVTYYEGINARDLPLDLLLPHTACDQGFDLVVMDVSFISQALILPEIAKVLRPGGQLLSLVKPQFEVGKEGIGKGGIVRDASLYRSVEVKISRLCQDLGFQVNGYFDSPIKGGDGNREFFISAIALGSA